MRPAPDRIRRAASVVLVVAALGVGACSSSDDADVDRAQTSATTSPAPVTTEQLFTPAPDSAADRSGTTLTGDSGNGGSTADTTVDGDGSDDEGPVLDRTTLATVPDTGVPGIDSTDAFCRGWSRFAGTFQALAVGWDQGDREMAARNEVAAAGAVLAAVEALDANVPAELEGERADLAAFVEPFSRRAAAGRDELAAAGVDPAGVAALGAAWVEALAAAGTDDPSIEIVVPAAVDEAALAAAADAFAAARPSLLADPSMITGVTVPQTEQYLIDNCPDRGTLLGNDDVAP